LAEVLLKSTSDPAVWAQGVQALAWASLVPHPLLAGAWCAQLTRPGPRVGTWAWSLSRQVQALAQGVGKRKIECCKLETKKEALSFPPVCKFYIV
jgi:hypothetical protein